MSTQDSLTRVATMLAAAALLAACGATDESAGAVHTREDPSLGTILVDTAGKTLYFTDQEEDGAIRCVGECLEFWIPVDGQDTAGSDVPTLDVRQRTDNEQDQLTYQGKPLYTFQLDKSAGDTNGHGVEDDFGGTHFVWHAVTVGTGAKPTGGGGGDSGGGGY